MKSGYGPELRTSRARRSTIPIEVIRAEVDEAVARAQNLILRQPVISLDGRRSACNGGARGARGITKSYY